MTPMCLIVSRFPGQPLTNIPEIYSSRKALAQRSVDKYKEIKRKKERKKEGEEGEGEASQASNLPTA